ncbi:MAG TPA: carboxypeptidase regulatory-like domain-containing protein, partial [Blastocatellia bacterium]|nr:carboxypeptidase regulatory-like domain-containing protein [Blastocatellia bacterium]
MRARGVLAFTLLVFTSITCYGQGIVVPRAASRSGSAPVVLPVAGIKIDARIDRHQARVRVEYLFRNDTDRALDATYYFPLPEDATLVELAVYQGTRRSIINERQIEDASQAAVDDEPAVREVVGRNWFRSRISSIPPNSTKRIEIVYSHIIARKDDVYTFEYPVGQGYKKLGVQVGDVRLNIDIGSDTAIKNVFSPTHSMALSFEDDCHVSGSLAFSGIVEKESFRLAYTLSEKPGVQSLSQNNEKPLNSGVTQDQSPTRQPQVERQTVPLSSVERIQSMQSFVQASPGTVVDSNGAVIPGATVTLRDQNTGATRTVTTDAAGNYSVAGVPPGTYKIEVEAPGFKKTEVQDVTIQTGQIAVAGVRLSPGAVAETVTVVSVAAAVDSTASHTSSNYESKKLRDLPSLAPVDSFARLAPGATSREASEINRQTGTSDKNAEFRLWFNGGRARSNNFTFDGQDNNDIDGRPVISVNNFDSV